MTDITNAPNNPLITKLKKIVETRIDNDEELIEGLKSLSDFFPENNIHTRRNLRSRIEQSSVDIHKDFLYEFTLLKEKFDEIDKNVTEMNGSCLEMTQRLANVKSQTQDLIQQTTQLRTDRQKLEMKVRIAEAMLAAFQLSPTEIRILAGNNQEPIEENFFTVMQRAKEISDRSHLLLRSHNQTAGLEIMDSMSFHMEAAYERLYRWAHNECRMQTQESPEISGVLCQSLQCLQQRPVLFKYVMDEFATARRNALVRCFIEALTRGLVGVSSDVASAVQGQPDGSVVSFQQRPIELLSHDPLRYCGDMLAWLHQGVASERELLVSLLKRCSQTSLCTPIPEVLNHITEGVCRLFKTRCEQVLLSEKDTLNLYRINNLLQFYKSTLSQLIKEDSSLYLTLDETQKLSWRLFLTSLRNSVQMSMLKPETPHSDLSPPQMVKDTLRLLETILTSQDVSTATLHVRKAEFLEVLTALVDSLVQYSALSASGLGPVETAAYLTNCFHHMQSALARLEFTETKIQQLQQHIEAHLDTLISEQAAHIIRATGLGPVYGEVQAGYDPVREGPMANNTKKPHLSAVAMKGALSLFDNYLASPDQVHLPQLLLLESRKMRELVRRRATDLVHTAYSQVFDVVQSSANAYPLSLTGDMRTPDQVAKLILNY